MMYMMGKRMYEQLLNGKTKANGRKIRGCGSRQGVVDYLNRTYGLLHPITDLRIEGK